MAKKSSTNKKGNNKEKDTKALKKKPSKNLKNQKDSKETMEENKNEFSRLVKIILIVTAIFAVFYVVTIIVTNKAEDARAKEEANNKSEEESEEVDIQYRDIMIGTMLNHGGTYYVLIQDKDEIRTDEYSALVLAVSSNEDSPSIYKANLTDTFNKKYLSKEENYYVDDISKFKVKGTTLVKIVDGKVAEAFDNYEAIKNKLTELS